MLLDTALSIGRGILVALIALVLILTFCCAVEAAPAGWVCGPGGCRPAMRSSSGPVRAAIRHRGPVRKLFGRLLARRG
jgi:hypothetical protein